MADVLLVHLVSPLKVGSLALPGVLTDIETNRRLLCGPGAHGWGVYAWFDGEVPATHRTRPAVVFTVDDSTVARVRFGHSSFAFMHAALREATVPIRFLGFLNVLVGYTLYTGPSPF